MGEITALGESPFIYTDYARWRWLHYGQQAEHVLALEPSTVLEVGPGDHCVSDFLTRKGIQVDTLDRDPELKPTWIGDIRRPLPTDGSYDVVLASEILEHMPYDEVHGAVRNLLAVTRPGGRVVISVPYTTTRLFPSTPDYGRIVSCKGHIYTGIPGRWWQRIRWPLRLVVRLARGQGQRAFEKPSYKDIPRDEINVHHWDLGDAKTSIRKVRTDLSKLAEVVSTDVRRNTNCVFYVLRRFTTPSGNA